VIRHGSVLRLPMRTISCGIRFDLGISAGNGDEVV
jgi:hypothetical protein